MYIYIYISDYFSCKMQSVTLGEIDFVLEASNTPPHCCTPSREKLSLQLMDKFLHHLKCMKPKHMMIEIWWIFSITLKGCIIFFWSSTGVGNESGPLFPKVANHPGSEGFYGNEVVHTHGSMRLEYLPILIYYIFFLSVRAVKRGVFGIQSFFYILGIREKHIVYYTIVVCPLGSKPPNFIPRQ